MIYFANIFLHDPNNVFQYNINILLDIRLGMKDYILMKSIVHFSAMIIFYNSIFCDQ